MSSKKVLYVASITGHITKFHLPYLKLFKENDYEVHVASNGEEFIENCDKHIQIPFERSPFKLNNIKAYQALKKLIQNENYDTIVCHTPVASILTRFAARKVRKKGTRVIYMSHGFHFYQGAPLKNWLIYYPIEKLTSRMTDDILTINTEDYAFAQKKLKAKNYHYVHGMGVDATQFLKEITNEEKINIRNSFHLKADDFVIFFAGELNENKNQIILIEAMKDLVTTIPQIKLLLAGAGPSETFLREKIAEYHLEDIVYLIGYRKDIPQILSITDLYISMSIREGLGLNLVEALMKKVPVIASDNRGHRDIIKNNENGYLIGAKDILALEDKIKYLFYHPEIRKTFSENARNGIEKFYLTNTMEEMKEVLLRKEG